MSETYKVSAGDTAWNFTKTVFEKKLNREITNQEVVKYMIAVKDAYECDSIDNFAKKYFRAGNEFEIKDSIFNCIDIHQVSHQDKEETLFLPQAEPVAQDTFKDSVYSPVQRTRYTENQSSTETKIGEKHRKKFADSNPSVKSWTEIKAQQDRINNLSTNQERIIAYQKELSESRDNYVIVDKENYTATVYSWDGNIVKTYEVGVAKEKSDSLLVRSKKHPENNIASTTAGIYTANYRATGKDAYRRLYNDRVLTLSNDGLRERGVGNGETGVAFHQIPNGNKWRTELLRREGATAENNRFSSRCVNFLPEDFDDCMSNITGVGTKVFILPEEDNNYFSVKNGKLHYTQKKYERNIPTTTTKNDPVMSIKISAKNSNMRTEGKLMASTLAACKERLVSDLGLDNDTYNELAMLTLGMAGQETQWGKPTAGINIFKGHCPYWVKENAGWVVDTVKKIKGNYSYDSRGITQLKIEAYIGEKAQNQSVKNLMQKYEISADNLADPQKAAIATMILLTSIYKDELPSISDNIKRLNMSKTDAILYCYSNHKKEIINGTAEPSKNEYVQNVRKCEKQFELKQSEETVQQASQNMKNKLSQLYV